MKSVRMASGLIVLVLALLLTLVLALAVYAQEPAGDETEEAGGISGQAPPGYTVLYMFTGAADNSIGADTIATSVHCTNYGDSTVTVRVEILDKDTDPVISGTTSIGSNRTMTFSSQYTTVYVDDVLLIPLGSDMIDQGFGRIMADSSSAQLICTAQTLDPTNAPPEFIINLDLFRP